MMQTWDEVRKELELTEEDERIIEIEKSLIEEMIKNREEQGLSQAGLAKKCNVKQPSIARMEKNTHSPQVDSLLRVLISMGYTLQIVPIN